MLLPFSKRPVINLTLACILCWLVGGVCLAQNRPQTDAEKNQGPSSRNARSSTDEFWRMLGSAFKEASNNRQSFWRLLEHSDVQKEIGLDESEFKLIELLNAKHLEELRALRETFKDRSDKDEMLKELVAFINLQDAAFLGEVAKHCDLNRLIEIDVQAYDLRAVTHAEIAKRIGLSSEKLAELRCMSDQVYREELGRMGDVIREGKKVKQLFAEIDKKVNDSLRMKLTSEEQDHLQQLRGAAFLLPADLLEPRRRGRGPGGPSTSGGGPSPGTPGPSNPGQGVGPGGSPANGPGRSNDDNDRGDKNRSKDNCSHSLRLALCLSSC
ncbi:MAG: hypothetical protein U0930_08545 [Pirellulales bacterium]